MPFYDYMCLKCGNEQEVLRSIATRRAGPECCGKTMKLLVSSPAFKINSTFQERLNKGYDKHKERVEQGLAKPNSIDRKKGNIG
jgi:putative FmdB family regulatory protein